MKWREGRRGEGDEGKWRERRGGENKGETRGEGGGERQRREGDRGEKGETSYYQIYKGLALLPTSPISSEDGETTAHLLYRQSHREPVHSPKRHVLDRYPNVHLQRDNV